MFRKLMIAALMMVQAGTALADTDTWGNRYPAQCSLQALERVYIPVRHTSQRIIDLACHSAGRVGCFTRTGFALVLDGLDAEVLADTIRHEKCHRVAGQWHPGKDGR